MLVLSRFIQERVVITTPSGERINVQVVSVNGDKVRLGFDADVAIRIDREEVHERIQREGRNT